ncbi:aminoglycoside phosphotransferase family protein [Streptomyces sp. J2-1]|uniref:aminoglycoside phosphotransferase family protein n=1 Tax=Streptomyces corallincola TaxID=2851888 RepID=UPI001C385C9F|nr:aminoglycoside phosphotransferase family protein [Streptomyces corallincola]MBV2356845.1 aminoglycoside phosphotransferase family protein [Streptomyces corallincola]
MTLHEGEIAVDVGLVRGLLEEQCPGWAGMELARVGGGSDNSMFRLGDELLVRVPRTAAHSVRKEHMWLPRLAPKLSWPVPEPVYAGTPTGAFPFPWSVSRWIDGEEAGAGRVADWSLFGAELASFVTELHGIDLMGARRADELEWYRGGSLVPCDGWVTEALDGCRALAGDALDLDALERMWRDALTLPEPSGPHVWLHGDLKPTNLLVRDGRLHAVIDFGALSVGHPDAEHAPAWDLPPAARAAYWNALSLSPTTWTRARAWAIAVGAAGLSYYWTTFPAFVAECRARLEAILTDTTTP